MRICPVPYRSFLCIAMMLASPVLANDAELAEGESEADPHKLAAIEQKVTDALSTDVERVVKDAVDLAFERQTEKLLRLSEEGSRGSPASLAKN